MDGSVEFFCAACGVRLRAPRDKAGITAPCPRCAAPVSSPDGAPPQGILLDAPPQPPRRRRSGRVIPDAGIDREHLDRRETLTTMKVLAWIVAALCACLAVAWLLKDWASR